MVYVYDYLCFMVAAMLILWVFMGILYGYYIQIQKGQIQIVARIRVVDTFESIGIL